MALPASARGGERDPPPRHHATLRKWRPNKESGPRTCSHDGIVDRVIPEFPDAADEPEPFCLRVGAALRDELAALGDADTPRRLTERAQRFDRIGQPDPVLAVAG